VGDDDYAEINYEMVITVSIFTVDKVAEAAKFSNFNKGLGPEKYAEIERISQ
jgi:hypothetical protein